MSSPKRKPSSTPTADPPAAPPAVAVSTYSLAAVPPTILSAAASYVGVVIKPPPYDPTAARAALDALHARLLAIPADQLLVPRLDVRAAALAALGVHAFVTQTHTLYERYKKLASIGEFDLRNIDDLKALSFIVLYAYAQAESAGAFKTDAKVPVLLVQKGADVEARMQELCEYKFKRDPQIAPLLDLLRPGSGHRDLASDLNGYADIYDMRPDEVALDTTNYRPTDVADARTIAGEILSHLSLAMSPQAKEAYQMLQRAWTAALDVYFEVREVGRCLLRHDPNKDKWLPSLFAAGRSGRPRKKKPEEPTDVTGEGAPPTG